MYVYYRGLKYISTNVTVARAALLFTHICPKASRDNAATRRVSSQYLMTGLECILLELLYIQQLL